ncbi:MAG: acyl--CoA ligase [Anaerolineales bacterium]|nr:acyl--CoA ligase [Anaerolineales bacterium]
MQNLIERLAEVAAKLPNKIAIASDDAVMTYGDLCRQVATEAAALRDAGFTQGDRLLFWAGDKGSYIVALLACVCEGIVLVPLHPQSPAAWQHTVAEQLQVAGTAPGLISSGQGDLSLCNCRSMAQDRHVIAILLTSGSTGVPRAVPIHAGMAAAGVENAREVLQLDPGCIFLDYIPPFTVGGLFLTGLSVLAAGGTLVIQGFSPFQFGDIVRKRRPTHAILLPTMVSVLRNTSSWRDLDLSGFTLIASGATTVPESVAADLLSRGAKQFLHLYGSTECLTPVMQHLSTAATPGRRTIFTTLCGDYQARLAADGELMLRGQAVMRGYLGDPAENADAFEAEWFKTGDLFTQEEGVWQFTGRKKEILKVGGFSVSPAQIERVIMDVSGVRNCVVTKEVLTSGGEALVAIIEGGIIDEREVLSYCAAQLPPPQRPRRILQVDSLPLNAMRKVDRRAVEEMLRGHA